MLLVLIVTISLFFISCSDMLDNPNLGMGESKVGTIGPGGGYIFYDKSFYSDGWRFLEAAPAGWSGALDWRGIPQDPFTLFGYYHINQVLDLVVGTQTAVGTGKANTLAMVRAMGSTNGYAMYYYTVPTTNYAAKVCVDYRGGGFADWFLPSMDELYLMYQNLALQGLGGFNFGCYWSSSEYNAYTAWSLYFSGGASQVAYDRWYTFCIRPVRAF